MSNLANYFSFNKTKENDNTPSFINDCFLDLIRMPYAIVGCSHSHGKFPNVEGDDNQILINPLDYS